MPVNLALIGCGAVVEKLYLPAIAQLPGPQTLHVAAALDPNPERIASIAARFLRCKVVDRISDLPADIDLALVASPPQFHARQTIELLERGIHVLCEKPMAVTSQECRMMIEAGERSGRLLSVGHMRRFLASAQQIKSIIANAALGRALTFRMLDGVKYQWEAISDAYFRRETAGGLLRDVGVHALDLMLWWFGSPSHVDYRDDAMGGVEANAKLDLSYASGLRGEVLLSRDWNLRQEFRIQFEKGWITCGTYDAIHIDIGLSRDFVLRGTVANSLFPGDQSLSGRVAATLQQAFVHQLLNVVQTIAGNEKLMVPGQEGSKSVDLIERCLASRRLIDMPWMSDREMAAARALA